MARKSPSFDCEVRYQGEYLRAVGTIDPPEPATGPTYDCGGTPGCPASVDSVTFYDESGKEIEDPDNKILEAVEDRILQSFDDGE